MYRVSTQISDAQKDTVCHWHTIRTGKVIPKAFCTPNRTLGNKGNRYKQNLGVIFEFTALLSSHILFISIPYFLDNPFIHIGIILI